MLVLLPMPWENLLVIQKEGTAEQAARDEKKFNDMHQQHENDRKRWNEEKQAYEDLLDEAENKL